jgi:hypothetical protein
MGKPQAKDKHGMQEIKSLIRKNEFLIRVHSISTPGYGQKLRLLKIKLHT